MAFAPTVAIWLHGPVEEVALSILKPVSFDELSAHVRLIWLEDAAEAERLPGALGMVTLDWVVALAVFVVLIVVPFLSRASIQ